jgi:hypothetical protein
LLLRPDDAEAQRGLDEARLLASKRSGKAASFGETLGLGALVLERIGAWTLALTALAGGAFAGVGLVLRRFTHGVAATTGTLALVAGLTALGASAALAAAQVAWLEGAVAAVVIVERAPLLDASGRAVPATAPLLEGTELRARPGTGGLLELELARGHAYIRRSQVRLLSAR